MRIATLCLILAGCGAHQTPQPQGLTLQPHIRVTATTRKEPQLPGLVSREIRAYRRAEKALPKSITHPDVPAGQIRSIYEKRDAAHQAVQDAIDEPSPEKVKAAKAANEEFLRAQRSESFGVEKSPLSGPASH